MPWQMWTITAALPDFSRPPPSGCFLKIDDDVSDDDNILAPPSGCFLKIDDDVSDDDQR